MSKISTHDLDEKQKCPYLVRDVTDLLDHQNILTVDWPWEEGH
jgi:hypothetical protein